MILAEADETAGSHAEEDENYFVSMTDMMVGILFIFIIMLMVFALNFQQQTDKTETLTQQQREQIEKAQELARQIAQLQVKIDGEVAQINRADMARTKLLETIRDRLNDENPELKVTISSATGVLRLGEQAIEFASDDSTLNRTASSNVDTLSRVLLDILPAYAACPPGASCSTGSGYMVETVFIEGHTDNTGQDSLNWQLSTQRAVNTYRRIVENFPGLRDLKNSTDREILSVSGYSSTRPASARADSEGRKINRRIDLRFVMEADREKRLNEVTSLLDQMRVQVEELQESARNGLSKAPQAEPEARHER